MRSYLSSCVMRALSSSVVWDALCLGILPVEEQRDFE